jgi:prolyl oligopeptidase
MSCAESSRPPVPPPSTPVDAGAGPADAGPPEAGATAAAYPPTRVVDATETLHGVTVRDPYRWLEDAGNPEVRAWMDAQDAYARERLQRMQQRDAIAVRLRELFYIESTGLPRRFGDRYFYTRREASKEKAAVYWKERLDGKETVLLDPAAWSADGTTSLGSWSVSWDGRRVAYSVKANNSDEATMHVMEVATGKTSERDIIEGAKYAQASWAPAGDGFYYVWLPTDPSIPVADRPGSAELRFHKLGDDPAHDAVVHPSTGDPKTFLNGYVSKDGRWLIASISHGWNRSDVYFQDLSAKAPHTWKPLVVGVDASFDVDVHKNRFYVLTNDGAPNGRVYRVDPLHPSRDKWELIVPESAGATLQSLTIVGGRLALDYLKDVSSRLEVRELDGKPVREVALPGVGTASNLVGDADRDEAFYSFTSYTYPTEIFRTGVKEGKASSWYRLKVPVDAGKFAVEKQFAQSKDGTKVPLFIVRPKEFKKDGAAPTMLWGYGGFQVSVTPGFSTSIFPWLERGGIYVYAVLRGGNEYGEKWHRDGMKRVKQNTFDDFIAVAEYLEREKYTSPGKLVIRGGSNGGLLVGAAVTQRPELFRAAICEVPLLDMVRYHRFGSGKTWIEEYGSADDPEDFRALFAYSPYHHVRQGEKYPSVLMLSADSDDRVDPMHARKFAAILQASSAGGPVLLRIEKHAGHGGADLVKAAVEKGADIYAFALSQITEPRASASGQPNGR